MQIAGLRVLEPDRLEEDGDAHAHPHGERDVEVVRLDPELGRVPGQYEQLVLGHVGRDHLQAGAEARVVGEVGVDEVGERADSLGLEPLADPLEEAVAFVEAEVEQHAQRALDQRHLVLPALVLELPVVEVHDDLAQLGRRVAGREQGRADRARRRAGDVLVLVAALLQRRERAGEPDPLHASAFEDEVGVIPVCGHAELLSLRRAAPPKIELALCFARGDHAIESHNLLRPDRGGMPWHTLRRKPPHEPHGGPEDRPDRLHTMEMDEKGETAENCAQWFRNPGAKVSAHYCVDSQLDRPVRRDGCRWAAPAPTATGSRTSTPAARSRPGAME